MSVADDDAARRWAAISSERARLLALARSRVPHEADAEDCAHEAMVRAMEFAGLDEERLPQFLTTVTIRLCVDHHRGRARRDRAGRHVALRETAEPGPEEVVCDRSEAEWLARHVDTLPRSQRDVVLARAEGLSCLGVAERLDVPDTTVESALARARRSLRRALESSLGLAPWGRRALTAGGVATVSALALLHLPDLAEPQRRAVPPRRPAAVAEARRPVESVGRDVPAAVVAPVSRPRAAGPAGVAAGRPPRPRHGGRPADYAGGVAVPGAGANIETKKPGRRRYSAVERAGHCLEHGVYVAPRTDCGYPPGDPDNDRFPDGSIVITPPPAHPEVP